MKLRTALAVLLTAFLVSQVADVRAVASPYPWTIVWATL